MADILQQAEEALKRGDIERAEALLRAAQQGLPAPDQAPSGMTGFARQLIGQGAMMGFGDEAEAGVRSLFSDRPYEDIRDEIRGENKAYVENNPYTALGAETAGSLVTGLAGIGRLAAARAATTLPKLMGLGAAEGAVYGAGTGEGGLAEHAKNIGIGAGTGIAGGMAGKLLFDPIARAAAPAGNKVARLVRNRLEDSGITDPAELMRRVDEVGPGGVVGDVGDMQAMTALAANKAGGRETVRNVLEERRGEQWRQVTDAVQDVAGTSVTPYRAAQRITEVQKEATRPLYDEVYRIPVSVDSDIAQAVQTPQGQAALRLAAKEYAKKNKLALEDVRKDIDGDSWMGMTDMQFWDEWQRQMRIASRGDPFHESLRTLANDSFDRQTGGLFADARRAHAQAEGLKEVMAEGEKILSGKVNPAEIADQVAMMTPEQLQVYKIGLVQGVENLVKGGPETAAKARKILDFPSRREAIQAVFADDPDGFDNFMRRMQGLATQSETQTVALTGSRTAPLQMEEESIQAPLGVAADVAQGNLLDAAKGAMNTVADPSRMSEDQMAELAKYLTATNSPEGQALIDELFRRGQPSPYWGQVPALVGLPMLHWSGLMSE